MALLLDNDRTKGFRPKENGQFSDFIPFGTQGEYVDMYSGLSLEQEMLLGAQHQVSITKTSNKTTINDYYKDKDDVVLYEMQTEIEKKENPTRTEIKSTLWTTNQISGNDRHRDKKIKEKLTIINSDGSSITQSFVTSS